MFDQNFGCNESIILLCQFLNQLLVLVHLFQVIDAHDIHTELFRPINIVGVSKHTDSHLRTGDGGKFDLTRETLVTAQVSKAIEVKFDGKVPLGIIVLQADLQFDGFGEIALLLF